MEERMARLGSHVEHIHSDIVEIKTDVRRLDQKIDSVKDSLEHKIDALRTSQDRKIDSVEEKMDALKERMVESHLSMERAFSKLTLWGLTLYVALAASLLGVMAKGFGWIQ